MTNICINRHTFFFYSLMAYAFTIPCWMKLNNILLFVCALAWLIQGGFLSKIKSIAKSRVIYLLGLLFVMNVVGYFLSENKHEAVFVIEKSLPLMVLPILFTGIEKDVKQQKQLALAFSYGTALSVAMCLSNAMYKYLLTNDTTFFFYHDFASFVKVNAIYLSCYVSMSMMILLCFQTKWHWLLMVVLMLALILLSSKLFIVLSLLIAISVKLVWNKYKSLTAIAVLLAIVMVLLVPKVNQRFVTEVNANWKVVSQDTFRYDSPFTGATLRLVIWKNIFVVLNEQSKWLTGVGIGDAQEALNKKYISTGMYTGNPELKDTGYLGYNAHNQYMQTLLHSGVIGVLVLLCMCYFAIRNAWYSPQKLYVIFLLLVFSFFFTESVLATNKGIIFFSFFISLFWVDGQKKRV